MDQRLREVAPDFRVEDAWDLPATGGPGELPRLVRVMFGHTFVPRMPPLVRFVWEARWKLGRWFGWDRADGGIGVRVPSLKERLPADLTMPDLGLDYTPFAPLCLTDDEFAAEFGNRTVHAIMHLTWVPDGDHHRGRMSVLVRPNGRLGSLYMLAIKPFRYVLVYPALMRQVERDWAATAVA